MYEFANRADIELKFVFHKRNADKTYHCDFRPANSLVLYTLGGHTFYYSGKRIQGRVGDIVVIPYGAHYDNELLSDNTEYYQIDFGIYENEKPQAVANEPTVIKNIHGEVITELFINAYNSYVKNGQGDRLLCIADILRILAFLRKSTALDKKTDVCEEIFSYIKENCTSEITACGISERFHISISLLEKKIKKAYGMSPLRLKNFLRIETAKQLLAEGYTIEETACKTGFCDRYHFTKTFISFEKCSPTQFLSNLRV